MHKLPTRLLSVAASLITAGCVAASDQTYSLPGAAARGGDWSIRQKVAKSGEAPIKYSGAEAAYRRGCALYLAGKPVDALTEFLRAARMSDEVRYFEAAGVAAMEARFLADAEVLFSRATELDPSRGLSFSYLAGFHYARRDYAKGEDARRRALALTVENPILTFALAAGGGRGMPPSQAELALAARTHGAPGESQAENTALAMRDAKATAPVSTPGPAPAQSPAPVPSQPAALAMASSGPAMRAKVAPRPKATASAPPTPAPAAPARTGKQVAIPVAPVPGRSSDPFTGPVLLASNNTGPDGRPVPAGLGLTIAPTTGAPVGPAKTEATIRYRFSILVSTWKTRPIAEDRAEQLRTVLADTGLTPEVRERIGKETVMYRVVLNGFEARHAAETALEDLKIRLGIPDMIVLRSELTPRETPAAVPGPLASR